MLRREFHALFRLGERRVGQPDDGHARQLIRHRRFDVNDGAFLSPVSAIGGRHTPRVRYDCACGDAPQMFDAGWLPGSSVRTATASMRAARLRPGDVAAPSRAADGAAWRA